MLTNNTPVPQFVQPAVTGSNGLFITNECNMLLMSRYPDNYFDLAIVDPPYGIGEDGGKSKGRTTRTDGTVRNGIDGRNGSVIKRKTSTYTKKDWDKSAPNQEYFDELFRVSKNQIIWGANHFLNKTSSCWIVWDKVNKGNDFADCELAYTSFNTAVRKFTFMWNGMLQGSKSNGAISEGNKSKCEKRIHPTQKPVKLYSWLLKNYAKEGFKILDTHLGSGSIAIAVDAANKIEKMNLTLTACELDKEYFDNSMLRIKENTNWQSLF
jgi:site-specific DNA-methyltransferase (adenine-specific)